MRNALALGAVAAAVLAASAWLAPVTEGDAPQMPRARVGDEVSYVGGTAGLHAKQSFTVLGAGVAIDHERMTRPVVDLLDGAGRVHRIDAESLQAVRIEESLDPGDLAGQARVISFSGAPSFPASLMRWPGLDPAADAWEDAFEAPPFGAWPAGGQPETSMRHGTLEGRPIVVLEASARSTVRQVWLSPEQPFPVAFVQEGPTSWRMVGSFTAGDGAAIRPADLYPGAGVDVAPVASRHPLDRGSGLSFTLDEALAGIEGDPSLVHYRTWRMLNPEAALVGFGLIPTDVVLPNGHVVVTHEWGIRFSNPEGESLYMIAQKDMETGVVYHNDPKRSVQILPEIWAARPMTSITLGDAAAVWAAFAQENDLHGHVNYLTWGCYRNGALCTTDLMEQLVVGHHGVYEPGLLPDGGRWDWAAITMDPKGQLIDARITEDAAAFLEHYDDPLAKPQAGRMPDPVAAPVLPDARWIAAAAGAFALAVAIRLTAGALWAGYSRIQGPEALRHTTRNNIMQFIQENPGATPTQLSHAGIAPWSTLNYHLRRLEACGLVRVVRVGRARQLFPADVAGPDARREALATDTRGRQIIALVAARPGASQVELARAIGIRAPSLIRHLRRLEAAGLLQATRAGGRVRYSLSHRGSGP